jgi:hypothetical protein
MDDDDIDDCDDEDVEGLAMMEKVRDKLNSRHTISVMGIPWSREGMFCGVEDTGEERNKTTNYSTCGI